MPKFRKFIVEPSLPEKLKPLEEIAYNLWWTWNPDAVNLLRRLDREKWESFYHNPIRVLGSMTQDKLNEIIEDDGFITHMEQVRADMEEYVKSETWFESVCPKDWDRQNKIAYFSFEFGIDETLPIYSGGLGVLAGDHLKSSSDLGIPLVAVGLAYSHGYFAQYLNPDGWQQEQYPENSLYLLPLRLQKKEDGSSILVDIPYPERTVYAQIWKAEVGRVPLYLLDTNIPENSPEDQMLTSQLYGGDHEMRMKQEILLGVGGVRALKVLGINAVAFHMNEGHSAFMGIERIRQLMMEDGFSFWEAKEAIIASTVFTTHTPVPAGNDRFEKRTVEKYLSPVVRGAGVNMEDLIALGRENPLDSGELFCMTVVALRLSAASNGVSRLHGDVSRKMWQRIWPDVPVNQIPIRSITNGIHIRTWISEEMRHLFDRYLGIEWISKPGNDTVWRRIDKIPDAELWRTHERRRERLVAFARKRLTEQLRRRGVSEAEIKQAEEALDPEALTIGFARRFATYKRGTLILRDEERLKRLLTNRERPVQIIFAGKAHPADNQGKEFIKQIIHIARKEEFRRRIVFLENYDMDIARYLVQGCDVWLNNPRRPLEASGTSGMKVSANGGLNLSILDGWWDEAYEPEVGWAIGMREEYDDKNIQDAVESKALYDHIERDIVPLFYERGMDGLPRGWVAKMKSSMKTLNPKFNTNRMVREYTDNFYIPLGERWHKYVKGEPQIIKSLAAWKQKLKKDWKDIRVIEVTEEDGTHLAVGQKKRISVDMHLGSVSEKDVLIEIFYGPLDNAGNISDGKSVKMECDGKISDNIYRFVGGVPCDNAGLHGYAIRILPEHEHLVKRYIPGLIYWG